ncbi:MULTISPECIES: hypothetical protein [unclassified Vibrio]|uniref:hypothetical protein n=1 Tax=Vibrio TaxID=662 RepID=UPI0012694A12|nr:MULTISPECIES: hypothetical protein [unclassified Vibrio]QFT40064.1 hypothetical protein FIU99_27110 [Vibrio sp. THAF64]QGM38009.1 hypothetical protein GGC04_27315 [Vibrio sp. THAF191d]QGN73531.1 hypothetical protein GGC03_27460 [Vibrio sp. THAF191c]
MNRSLFSLNLRKNEFKLRQREASYVDLTTSQKKDVQRLLAAGFSKKAIRGVFGCSYEALKSVNLGC